MNTEATAERARVRAASHHPERARRGRAENRLKTSRSKLLLIIPKTPAMTRLSSYSTLFKKYLFPIIPLGMCVVCCAIGHQKDRSAYILAGVLILGFAWIIWWARPIRFVSTDGEQFLITDLRRRISVPVSQLRYWTEDRHNRSPSICLYFDPPTEFGSKVRIISPTDWFSQVRFDAVAQHIAAITGQDRRRAKPTGGQRA